jgi:peptide deformylase
MEEGCLSFPLLYLKKRRPEKLTIKYQNVDGDFIETKFEGLAARVFHHEMDHMEGKTFLDGVSKILLQSARRKQKTLIKKAKKTS